MNVKQLVDVLRRHSKQRERLGRRDDAATLNDLATLLAKLPQGQTVAKALKKPPRRN